MVLGLRKSVYMRYNLLIKEPEMLWLYQAISNTDLAGHNFKDEREVNTGVLVAYHRARNPAGTE